MSFDWNILYWLQAHHTSVMDEVMTFITKLGDKGIIWILITLLLLLFVKTRRVGVTAVFALVIMAVVCLFIIKPIVARPRPFQVDDSILMLIEPPSGYSFPSGHTASSFTVVSVLFYRKSKLWIPACVLACVIAFSRMYLFVHYPTDILAGIIIGIISGWLGKILLDWMLKRYPDKASKLRII